MFSFQKLWKLYFGDARAKVKAVNNVVTRIVTWSNLEIYCLW